MKKIGICACYDNYNYGSMLQAYATQAIITELGYSNEYIVYKKKKNLKFVVNSAPRIFNGYFIQAQINSMKKKKELKKHPEVCKSIEIRKKAFNKFQKDYYKEFSKPYIGYKNLKKGAENYDSIVVGSDQLWLPIGLGTNFYNLMFVPDNINKISYATSFGVSSIPWYQKSRTKKYLNRIKYLSTREIKGKEIIKEISGRDAEVVVDPTLLFNGKEWLEKIKNKNIIEEKYIFCYFLGKVVQYRKEAEKLASEKGYKIVTIPHLDEFVEYDESFGDIRLYDVGPAEFVNLIRNAEYICTDSFHGTVFSLLNHKKFIIFNRFQEGSKNSRNSRIDSLCTQLNISDRRYDGNINNINKEIDYEAVDKKLDELRDKSKLFLKNALEMK